MSAFTDRLARKRRRAHDLAVAQAEAELEAKMASDPHSEPKRRHVSAAPPAIDDETCPAWILRRARGEQRPGDPGVDRDGEDIAHVGEWPADVLPLVEDIIGFELQEDGEDCPPTGWHRLEVEDLPTAPFKLQPWAVVTNPARWLEDLRREVARGPSGARARLGALQSDLRFLALRMRGDPSPAELEDAHLGPAFG